MAAALKYAVGTAMPGLSEPAERLRPPKTKPARERQFLFRDGNSVEVRGWDGWRERDPTRRSGGRDEPGLNLPSFSGRLPDERRRPGAGRTALLRYDLRLGPARGVRLRPPVPTEVRLRDQEPLMEGVLGGPMGLIPCIQVDGVQIVARRPEKIRD